MRRPCIHLRTVLGRCEKYKVRTCGACAQTPVRQNNTYCETHVKTKYLKTMAENKLHFIYRYGHEVGLEDKEIAQYISNHIKDIISPNVYVSHES